MPGGGRRSTTFKPGQGKPKGAKHKTTLLKEAIGLTAWEKIDDCLNGPMAEKLIEEAMKLKGKDYIYAATAIAEFFKPKRSRVAIEGGDKPVEVKQVFRIGGMDVEL